MEKNNKKVGKSKMENVIYSYKYIFTIKGSEDKANMLVYSGPMSEQDKFVQRLLADECIEKVVRFYIHEIDVDKCELPEVLKENKKVGVK